jgi:DNA replication protein DnaC
VVDETLGLIGDRISAGRATIVTTNEKPEALSLMLTERVLSRLSEHGHVLTLLHADRRGRLSW